MTAQSTASASQCRICLQAGPCPGTQSSSPVDALYSLPCLCKGDIGQVHARCLKQWIKVWIEDKIRNQQGHGSSRTARLGPRAEASDLRVQNQHGSHPKLHSLKAPERAKPLNPLHLQPRTPYPFPCEICHCPIYFDLLFHRCLKPCPRRAQVALFLVALLVTVLVLGVCVNWVAREGVSVYWVLFYVLVWVPLLGVTVGVGVATFTHKQFWVGNVYGGAAEGQGGTGFKELTNGINMMNMESVQRIHQSAPQMMDQLSPAAYNYHHKRNMVNSQPGGLAHPKVAASPTKPQFQIEVESLTQAQPSEHEQPAQTPVASP